MTPDRDHAVRQRERDRIYTRIHRIALAAAAVVPIVLTIAIEPYIPRDYVEIAILPAIAFQLWAVLCWPGWIAGWLVRDDRAQKMR